MRESDLCLIETTCYEEAVACAKHYEALEAAPDRLTLEFAAVSPGSAVELQVVPRELGAHGAQIWIQAAGPLALRQFTYP